MLTLRSVNRKVGKRWIVDSNIDGKHVRRFFTSKSAGQTYLAELRLQQREAGQAWMTLEPEEHQLVADGQPTLWRAVGLPAGLSLDATTGLISGRPEEEGVFEILIVAANRGGAGTQQATLTVLAPPRVTASNTSGMFRLNLDGVTGIDRCVIETSTNLVDWLPVYTNAAPGSAWQYDAPIASDDPMRFYRAVFQ